MRTITISFTDTPTAGHPHKVTITAGVSPHPQAGTPMSPAMRMAAACLEFVEAHSAQDQQEAASAENPRSLPPHLQG